MSTAVGVVLFAGGVALSAGAVPSLRDAAWHASVSSREARAAIAGNGAA